MSGSLGHIHYKYNETKANADEQLKHCIYNISE